MAWRNRSVHRICRRSGRAGKTRNKWFHNEHKMFGLAARIFSLHPSIDLRIVDARKHALGTNPCFSLRYDRCVSRFQTTQNHSCPLMGTQIRSALFWHLHGLCHTMGTEYVARRRSPSHPAVHVGNKRCQYNFVSQRTSYNLNSSPLCGTMNPSAPEYQDRPRRDSFV